VLLPNFWYVAAWSFEVGATPLARIILDKPILLARNEAGELLALDDRCPHRFAPLHLGKVMGNSIECAYHGLRFGKDGKCTLNPHGDGGIPPKLRVRSYPVQEKFGAIWVFCGDPVKADSIAIPDFPPLVDGSFVFGYDHFELMANYELISDNLLDLSHSEYLHPDLNQPGANKHAIYECFQKDDTVYSNRLHPEQQITRIMRELWASNSSVGNRRANLRWDPPGLMLLDVGMTEVGQPTEGGACLPSVHFLTPKTEHATHYFTAIGRNARLGDPELTERLRNMNRKALVTEDGPMIEAQEQYLFGADFRSLRPVLLPFDSAAARARRVMDKHNAASIAP
jgi:vanillate O-demethylase monooxygenase subunit